MQVTIPSMEVNTPMDKPLFDSLEIRQFRAFDYIKIEQLGHINLFLGKNNVGKSTLLESLCLHANLGSPQVIQWILNGRDEPGEMRHGNTVDPTVWSLFHGHPALERIKESIQIGRVGAPDSALTLSVTWLRKAGGQLIRRRFNNPSELTALAYSSLVEHLVNAGTVRTRPFDAAACPEAALDDLSRQKVQEFLARAQAERNYPLGPRTPTPKALAHLNLLDGEKPTHAAVLLFGKQPQRFLLTSEVKCLQFHGTTVAKPIPDYRIFKGTVFELVDQALGFVMSKIAASVGTRADSSQAPVTYEFPRAAVAEAIVNAVAHRDYASNASVQVMLFADRLEVWNPGELPPSLTPASLRLPHASIPRNPLLAEPLFLTRHIEKAGTGILDMIGLCKAAKLRPPEFRQEMGQFIQTLWRPTSVIGGPVGAQSRAQVGQAQPTQSATQSPTQSSDPVGRLLLALKTGPKSAGELRELLDLKHRPTFRENYLHPALEKGFIENTIPDKPNSRLQKYRLTDKGRARLEEKA